MYSLEHTVNLNLALGSAHSYSEHKRARYSKGWLPTHLQVYREQRAKNEEVLESFLLFFCPVLWEDYRHKRALYRYFEDL